MSGPWTALSLNYYSSLRMNKAQPSTTPAQLITPEDLGRQITSPEFSAFTSMWTQDRANTIQMQVQLIELRIAFLKKREVFLNRLLFGVVFTACIFTGLLFLLYLQRSG